MEKTFNTKEWSDIPNPPSSPSWVGKTYTSLDPRQITPRPSEPSAVEGLAFSDPLQWSVANRPILETLDNTLVNDIKISSMLQTMQNLFNVSDFEIDTNFTHIADPIIPGTTYVSDTWFGTNANTQLRIYSNSDSDFLASGITPGSLVYIDPISPISFLPTGFYVVGMTNSGGGDWFEVTPASAPSGSNVPGINYGLVTSFTYPNLTKISFTRGEFVNQGNYVSYKWQIVGGKKIPLASNIIVDFDLSGGLVVGDYYIQLDSNGNFFANSVKNNSQINLYKIHFDGTTWMFSGMVDSRLVVDDDGTIQNLIVNGTLTVNGISNLNNDLDMHGNNILHVASIGGLSPIDVNDDWNMQGNDVASVFAVKGTNIKNLVRWLPTGPSGQGYFVGNIGQYIESSTASPTNTDAYNAFDGDVVSPWVSQGIGSTRQEYLGFQFNIATIVNYAKLKNATNFTSLSFECSNDGLGWTPLTWNEDTGMATNSTPFLYYRVIGTVTPGAANVGELNLGVQIGNNVMNLNGDLNLGGRNIEHVQSMIVESGFEIDGDVKLDGNLNLNSNTLKNATIDTSNTLDPKLGACPVGTVIAWGGSDILLNFANTINIPTGFLLCEGSPVLKTDYPALHAIIADTFGTDGGLHFNVPDLRGYFIRGYDDFGGHDPDANSRAATPGNPGGATGNHTGSYQGDDFKTHTHSFSTTDFNNNNGIGRGDGVNNSTSHNTSTPTNIVSGSETRPKNVFMMYIIKY